MTREIRNRPTDEQAKYDKKIPKPTMFEPDITKEDQLKAAYRLKNKEIAFSPYTKQPAEQL